MNEMKTLIRLTGVELLKFRSKSITWVTSILLFGLPVLGELIQVQLSQRDAVYPRAGYFLFGSDMLLFVALITIVVSVMALGNDYELKTVRSILGRGTARYQFILAKIMAVFAAALFNGLVYIAGALSASIIGHRSLSEVALQEAAGSNLFWRALGAVGVILLVEFVSAGAAMLALVLGRTAWSGMFGGLGFFFVDYFVGGLAPTDLLGIEGVYRYTVTYHALGILTKLFPSDPKLGLPRSWSTEGFAEPGGAVAFILIYGCILTLLAILIFKRQDLMAQQ
jgi:ABC-type transport system involved in multi-copper enzyme maturation permease subunit